MKSEKDATGSAEHSAGQDETDCAGQEECSGEGSLNADCCTSKKRSWTKVVIFVLVMLAAAAVGGYSLYLKQTAAQQRPSTTVSKTGGEKIRTAVPRVGASNECGGTSGRSDSAPACCSNPSPCCGN